MRILVCGGRAFSNLVKMDAVLSGIVSAGDVIIHGGARGADSMADRWARMKEIAVEAFPTEWSVYGRSAGPIRSKQMIVEGRPDLVVAFAGGRGTADMIACACSAGVEVKVC